VARVPENVSEFIDEIATGLADLYGPDAATQYRRAAPHALRAALLHPAVRAVTATRCPAEGGRSARPSGLSLAVTKSAIAQITLVHVLKGQDVNELAAGMVCNLVDLLRHDGVDGIVCEAVPMVPMDLTETFGALGFTRIARYLMIAALSVEGIARPSLRESRPLLQADLPEMAETITEAYRDHPGRHLHAEVRTIEGAMAFLDTATIGGFGTTRAAFSRVIVREGRVVAGIVGSEIAPGVGFVLQVAVRSAYQSQGLGTLLLRDLAQTFFEGGYRRIALGVTVDNPARRLYERLGFAKHRDVDAFVWWRSSP
jgi:ribosomal protein S18 acetylase RimI-like enzyme